MLPQRILVTGAAGYIGSSLVAQLLDQGCSVIGVDRLLFGDRGLQGVLEHPRFRLETVDVRRHEPLRPLLRQADAVVHLAAIVGDPACSRWPQLARAINLDASMALFEAAHETPSIRRFVFASTCSNYGRNQQEEYCTESSALVPLSLYAELKVAMELQLLLSRTRADFIPTVLRFATAFGVSPRMRFDLTVNEFCREVALDKELEIYGRQFWRPYCHTRELARACVCVLSADAAVVDHQVFNVGATDENWTKGQLAQLLSELQPNARIRYVHKEEDRRDYKVRFDHIRDTLGFVPTITVRDGVTQLMQQLRAGAFGDPYASQYSNSSDPSRYAV